MSINILPSPSHAGSYGIEVDWWTIGALIFEMLVGLPPFYDENVQQMYQKILYTDMDIPEDISAPATSIIRGLLIRDPLRRLGHRGVDEIKSHLFFEGLNWAVSLVLLLACLFPFLLPIFLLLLSWSSLYLYHTLKHTHEHTRMRPRYCVQHVSLQEFSSDLFSESFGAKDSHAV